MTHPETKPIRGMDFVLAFLIAGVVFAIHQFFRADGFGHFQDSGLYVAGSRALALGQGYVMGDFLGQPKIGIYTPGWPFVLSWAWLWGADFPGNLIFLQSTVWFLIATTAATGFVVMRLMGSPVWFAAGVSLLWSTALRTHEYGVWLMSDFGLATMSFAFFAWWFCRGGTVKAGWFWAAGAFATLAFMWRTAGLGMILGVGILGLAAAWRHRSSPFRAAGFLAGTCFLPMIAVVGWKLASAGGYGSAEAVSSFFPAGHEVKGYLSEKLDDLINLVVGRFWGEMYCAIFGRIPAVAERYGTLPFWAVRIPVICASAVITFWVMRGFYRMRDDRWFPPTACVVAGYSLFVVSSPLPSAYLNRYLMPVWPLFAAALWRGTPLFGADKFPKAWMIAAKTVLALGLAANIAWLPRARDHWNTQFALNELRQASDWIRESTPPDAKIAVDWALPFVHLGVWSRRPLVADYHHYRWRMNFAGFEQQGMPMADYIVTTDQGYQASEPPPGAEVVFKSDNGHFVVSKLDPAAEAERIAQIKTGKDREVDAARIAQMMENTKAARLGKPDR